jgi:DNA-binding GntR family transcriptional regulator
MSGDDSADPRVWVRVTAQLRAQITGGLFPAGSPVPSINALTEQYDCSRQTCGKVMRQLEKEGLLVRVPGLGYYTKVRPR